MHPLKHIKKPMIQLIVLLPKVRKNNIARDSHHRGEVVLQIALLWVSLMTSIASITLISNVYFSHPSPPCVSVVFFLQALSIVGPYSGISSL